MTPRFTSHEKAKWAANPSSGRLRSPVRIPECENQDLIQKNKLTLVGRITNPRVQNTKALVSYMLQFWNLEGRVAGRELGPGKFQFTFKTEEDLQLVLSWSPFHFKHWMFILQRWEPIISDSFPANILFWIKLEGVPQHYWTDKALRAIGADVGIVEAVDTEEARIRVYVNALHTLEKQIPIVLPTGETTTVNLEYERLEKYCFQCFSLSHEQKDCSVRRPGSVRPTPERDTNKENTLSRLEESKSKQASRKELSRLDSYQRRDRAGSPRRFKNNLPPRRSPPRSYRHREDVRAISPARMRDSQRSPVFKRSGNRVTEERSQRFHRHRDQYSSSRGQEAEGRFRRSPERQRSPGKEIQSTLRYSSSTRHGRSEALNTPPPEALLPPPPPLPCTRGEDQGTSRARRPALERISGGEVAPGNNPFTGLSSSLSGRLQDVSIQYLGDEVVVLPGRSMGLELGSCSAPIHPTLSHRLSIDQGAVQEERRIPAVERLETDLTEITVSIPAKQPKAKAKAKSTRRTVAAATRSRGSKSPLQGMSSKKRNTTRSKCVAAKKRLCQDQGEEEGGQLPVEQPTVHLIPATRKNKAKVDFQKPPNPLP